MAESSVVPPSDVSDTQAVQSVADTQAAPTGGTDGGASQVDGTAVQTGAEGSPADGAAQAPARAAAAPQTAAPALTEDQWRQRAAAEAAEQKRIDDLAAANNDLREFRKSAPMRARDYFDNLAEEHGVYVPPAARKAFLDLVEEYGLKGDRAAKLELADSVANISGTLTEVSQGFYANFSSDDEAEDFSRSVRGKTGAEWVSEFAKRQQASGRADALVSLVEAGAAALPDELKAAWAEDVGKAETVEDLLKAYRTHVLKEAEAMPRGAPRGIAGAPAGGGRFRNLEALNAAKTAGQLTDAEFLQEQNKLLGVS
jgi:hypothetical protein